MSSDNNSDCCMHNGNFPSAREEVGKVVKVTHDRSSGNGGEDAFTPRQTELQVPTHWENSLPAWLNSLKSNPPSGSI